MIRNLDEKGAFWKYLKAKKWKFTNLIKIKQVKYCK